LIEIHEISIHEIKNLRDEVETPRSDEHFSDGPTHLSAHFVSIRSSQRDFSLHSKWHGTARHFEAQTIERRNPFAQGEQVNGEIINIFLLKKGEPLSYSPSFLIPF